MACRWCVIYVREDNDFNVEAMITAYVDFGCCCLRKAVKFNHSLSHPRCCQGISNCTRGMTINQIGRSRSLRRNDFNYLDPVFQYRDCFSMYGDFLYKD